MESRAQLVFSPDAGAGWVVRAVDQNEEFVPGSMAAEAVRFTTDPDAWAVVELEDGDDPAERLLIERDRSDAIRLLLIVVDPKTSPSTFSLAASALEPVIVRPEIQDWVMAGMSGQPLDETVSLTAVAAKCREDRFVNAAAFLVRLYWAQSAIQQFTEPSVPRWDTEGDLVSDAILKELVSGVQSGDAQAQNRLATLIYPTILVSARNALKHSSLAVAAEFSPSELANELWVRMFASRGKSLSRVSDGTGLRLAIGRNLVDILTDYARCRAASNRNPVRVNLEEATAAPAWLQELGADALDVREALHDLESWDPACAEACRMRYVLGFTNEEAAAAMGIPVIKYRRLIEFATKFLRKRLTRPTGT